ncbi:catechol O-methyltransferase B-like isoform X4 [Coregonus clupeaformis]|uniref:catechol O-methyltransferase B-like isoform X5 n=1 Tax=Coregonus clupeaformis TaxID=59861 RepID=UPI001BE0329B|nr:catechol O-methyltransferase B-like isoform X5 [Coregonus clupeaformis]XP_045078902.1 catechol O-methyltransferase B-like isoform X4 [Coregonus clupeaformis]
MEDVAEPSLWFDRRISCPLCSLPLGDPHSCAVSWRTGTTVARCHRGACSGHFDPDITSSGSILDSVVNEVSPVTVLELGTYCGYSTVRIACLLPPGASVITLEFNPDYAAIARQVIRWSGLEDKLSRCS